MSLFGLASGGLAMDLGTANTLVYETGRGIILNEPSVVALDSASRRVLAVGQEAKSYQGRAPQGIEIIRPLREGVISDFAVSRAMIKKFLELAGASRRFFRPKIVVGVPTGITQLEKKAVIEAAQEAGGKSVALVDEPLAAAVGLGLPIQGSEGQLVLDVGGGTSEGVVVSFGAIAVSQSRRVAGDAATEAIVRYLRRKYQLAVGENTAEHIKLTIGSAMPQEETKLFVCRGKDLKTGVPRAVEISDQDIREALADITNEFIDMVKLLISQTPPELAADLPANGLHLTGGGGLLKDLDKRLRLETGLPVFRPPEPLLALVLGLGQIMEEPQRYKSVFVS